jgi:LCP family protein required for cell wall assembly
MTRPDHEPPPSPPDARGAVSSQRGIRLGVRRRWPRRLLIGVNLVVFVCLVGAASVVGYVQYRFGQINTVSIRALRDGGSTPATQPFTMLVVGSDSRALTGANNAEFGSETETPGQRSDTILLVRVVPADHTLTILSIPRDLWVPIQGMGTQRINASFNNGANLLVSTIESDLGIPIDHYVEVNFDTFRQITDAVGGVEFYFPTPAKDDYSLLSVPQAGCVNLTGDQALAFVRSRHYEYYQDGEWHDEAESDLARIQRQQAFIKKMIEKAETEYTNPLALNGIIGAVTKNLTVDQGFTTRFMLGLATQLRTVDPATVPSETLPTYNETIDGAEVLGIQQPQASQMIAAFNSLGTTGSSTPPSGTGGSPPVSDRAGRSTSTGPVAPSSIAVEVANGSGVTGQAAQAVSDLSGLGFDATVDSTPGNGFTTNVIRYAPDSSAKAAQLSHVLAGGASLQEDSSLSATPYDLELITGSSYDGVAASAPGAGGATGGAGAPAATAPATTLPASTPATAAPTPPVTQYVLPGTPPGQQPPADCQL